MLAEITYARMSTFLVVSLVIYHGLAYQNNVFNQTLKLFNYYLMQLDSKKRRTANACVRRTWHVSHCTCMFFCDLNWTLLCFGLFQKDLSKERRSSAESFSKSHDYSRACHTRFAVFFPLPSCCVSSLISVAIMQLRAWQWPQNCFI